LLNRRFPALASRDFLIFWIGQFFSLIGSWMQSTVLPYLAYRLNDQPIYLGIIGFANTIPMLLLTLPAGVWVEHLDKRKTVIAMQIVLMLQAFALAYLALSHQITIWHIIILTFISGAASSIDITARQAMLVELVGRQALPNAIALNSTIFNAARVIGPALSAPFLVLLQSQGEGWAFFANGVSFLFVIIGLFFVRSHPLSVPKDSRTTMIRDFVEGQGFIRKSTIVANIIIMVAIFGFFGFPFSQQIPVFARDVLKTITDTEADVAARNSLLVVGQGVGALIAAFTLAYFSTIKRKGLMMTIGQAAFAFGLVGLSFAKQIGHALPMMMLVGWGTVTMLALANTLIQLSVPDNLRGRVISTYFWAQNGVAPFGSLLLGWMTQNWGASLAVLLGGAVCLLAAFLIHSIQPVVRRTII
jgi:MFS family permease